MEPIQGDHDSRRALEQHALRNVRGLVDKLGYRDALSQRKEKFLLIAFGVVVVVALAAMAVDAVRRAPKAGDEERARCELEVRYAAVMQFKLELRAKNPNLSSVEVEQRAEGFLKDMKPIAARECAGGYKPR